MGAAWRVVVALRTWIESPCPRADCVHAEGFVLDDGDAETECRVARDDEEVVAALGSAVAS